MNIFAASSIAPGHNENQDWFDYALGETNILVVADGAGSQADSAAGARLVCNAIIEAVFAYGATPLEAIELARDTLLEEPNHAQMGCTVALAIEVGPVWDVAIVGDSYAIVEQAGELSLLEAPPISEFANITTLMNSKNFKVQEFSGLTNVDAIALSTDGLYHSTVQAGAPVERFWTPIFERAKSNSLEIPELFAYMDGKELLSDDTTLIVATKD